MHEGQQCTAPAEQVDHVVPVHKGGSDDPSNLASLCLPHHTLKVQAEARAARVSAKRATPRHPGLIG